MCYLFSVASGRMVWAPSFLLEKRQTSLRVVVFPWRIFWSWMDPRSVEDPRVRQGGQRGEVVDDAAAGEAAGVGVAAVEDGEVGRDAGGRQHVRDAPRHGRPQQG